MDDNSKKPKNWFVRILISLFCLLLVGMVLYRYICVEPRGDISAGIVTLLCLLLVLVLAESFDNFSIGKLISVSREVKKKEKEVEKLEKQNGQLLSQLITISSSQTQTQSHTNVYGDYHAAPTVQKATAEEVRDKQSDEPATPPAAEAATQRVNWRKAEEIGLKKYLQLRSLHPSNVIVDAKLSTQFQGVDPISTMQPVFDAYIKDTDHETFVELRPEKFFSPMFRDRLYVMLSKINHYRGVKRIEAHLDLVMLKIPGEESRIYQSPDRVLESFEPAIASGLLKVLAVEFSAEEAVSCRE